MKHIGLAERNGTMDRAFAHLMAVNGWPDEVAFAHLERAFETWNERSKHQWELDLSWLRNLGITPKVRAS